MKKRKLIILLALTALLASCGGGGGGGNEGPSNSTTPIVPGVPDTSLKPNKPDNGSVPNNPGNPDGKVAPNVPDSKPPKAPDIKENVLSGEKPVNRIGILDTGFSLSDSKRINSEFGSRITVKSPNSVSSDGTHGLDIAEIIGGKTNGKNKDLQIEIFDISKNENGNTVLNLTADVYKNFSLIHILDKYKDGENETNFLVFAHPFSTDTKITDFNSNNYIDKIGAELQEYYEEETDNGNKNLYIWSAGEKENQTEPTLEAGLPSFMPRLENHWLAVVGLIRKDESKDFSIDNLKPLTQAGTAENWALSAIAETEVKTSDGSIKKVKGARYGTASVAATATLLQEKFPLINGELVKYFLLSSATDIGPVGQDRIYGWGLLNTEKALKGPVKLDEDLNSVIGINFRLPHVNIFIPGTYTNNNGETKANIWTFSNDISGRSGILKGGNGTLIFTGNNTYTGDTTIARGTLDIRKGVTSNIRIDENGTLIVNPETKIGTLNLDGTVDIKSSVYNIGTLENRGSGAVITGDYIAEKDSVTIADVNSKLTVKGKTTIKGDTKLQIVSNGKYITAAPLVSTVLSSENGVTGTFSHVETPELIEGKVETSNQSVTLSVSRKNIKEYVSSLETGDKMRTDTAENIEQAFKKLDSEIEKGNSEIETFALYAAKLQSMSFKHPNSAAVLDSLSGQIYASAQALTFQHSQTVNKDLSNRLVMLGTVTDENNTGLWVTGITAHGKLKEHGFGTGKTNVSGGQVGIDHKFGENLILGTALSYSKSDAEFDRYGGKSEIDGFGISLYGRLGNDKAPYYVQGRIGTGFVTGNVQRDILLETSEKQKAEIEHRDKTFSLYTETGYDFKKGNFVFTPFAGITYDSVTRGAFSEKNSQFGLTAEKKTYNRAAGLVGLRIGQSVNWKNGSKTTFQSYITHQKAFKNEDLSFEASYTGLADAKFKVKGIGLSRNSTWIGLGVLTEVTPAFSWYANYDGKVEKKGNNNVFTTGVRFSF